MGYLENRQKWIAALRSGKYEQGQLRLRSISNRYCCLGVACDVYQEEVGGLTVRKEPFDYSYDGAISYLPHIVAEWLNITTDGQLKESLDYGSKLTHINDCVQYTFEEIADMIEGDNLRPH